MAYTCKSRFIFKLIIYYYLYFMCVHGKNDFAKKSKILLDTDLKILLDYQNNFIRTLQIMSNVAKKF